MLVMMEIKIKMKLFLTNSYNFNSKCKLNIYIFYKMKNTYRLSDDIINNILSYDKHFIIRNGKLVSIIPKDDYRYTMLEKKSLIQQKNHQFSMYDGFSSIYGDYYGESVLKNEDGIETRIAVYEYPLLSKHIWVLYTYYPYMMASFDKIHFYM
jgi:hypothetical protein